MWTLRQKLQPDFRAIAGVVLALWLVATTVCTMHCAGLLTSASNSSRSCCPRDPSPATQSFQGSSSQPVPLNSSKKGTSGCLKEYLVGKAAQLTALKLIDSSQILWPTPPWAEPEFTVRFVARRNEPTRRRSPELIHGCGLRTLAPPSDPG